MTSTPRPNSPSAQLTAAERTWRIRGLQSKLALTSAQGPKEKLARFGISLGVVAAYFIGGKLGLALAIVHPSATAFWPPTGIALAALLLLGRGFWPAILAGAFLVNVTTAGSVWTSLGIATGNTLEAFAGSFLAERLAGGRNAFEKARRVLVFAATAGLGAPMLSATFGVLSLCLGGLAPWGRFASIWLAWWAGDVGGALVIGPFLILWALSDSPRLDPPRIVEWALALGASAGVGLIVFTGLLPYAFLCMVPIVWAAVRLDPRATASSTMLVASIGIAETLAGRGPFVVPAVEEPLLPLMLFLAVSSVGALAVAALMLERRRAEQELREFAQIVGSSEDAIVSATRDGTVTSWNTAAERLYGYGAGEALGHPVHLGHSIEDTQSIIGRLAVGEKVEGFDTLHHRKDGSAVQVSLSVSPVKDAAGRVVGISSIARDVSDRQRFFDLRQHAAGLAEENRRIQETSEQKSRFVSHLSHELRTPLTAIIGFSDLLREERLGPLTDVQTRCLQDIELSCQHLLRIVEEVLELAKLDANRIELRPEIVDIGHLVAEITDILAPLSAAKHLRMSACVDQSLNAEQADKGRLRQVLFNYLSNALKSAPEGGSVEVRAEPEDLDWWRLEVQDNGRGVPVELEKHLFQEFERLGRGASSSEGIGLGLAISKRIVEAQGGSVGYRPAPGGGAIFTARLPRAL